MDSYKQVFENKRKDELQNDIRRKPADQNKKLLDC